MAQSELRKIGIMKSSDDLASLNCAAAFVESGVQDAYEDSCSICLDTFTEEEPCCVSIPSFTFIRGGTASSTVERNDRRKLCTRYRYYVL